MNWQIILAGFGGQGMMFLGQLLAYSALKENNNTTWMPSYGPEMRGGTANCAVVISKKKVSSPVVSRPNLLVAMNQPSLCKFQSMVKPEGYLFVNSSLIDEPSFRKDITVVRVPANELAHKLGFPKVANIVMLGAIIGKTHCVQKESVLKTLEDKDARMDILELNRRALEAGLDL